MNMEQMNIKSLRNRYQSGTITPRQLIDNIMKRVRSDEDYNIWIAKPDLGFIQKYLEELKTKNPETHPLWGIPFAIKDNIDLAGVETTSACPDYAYMAETNSVVVQRLIDAGAIPIGKTNMDQFATGLVGTRSPYGEVHNAWKPELISGGSSAGSAVAVARGQAAFALGTDTAGSGRVPAALNNIIGLKSSVGAWPTKGSVPACASLDCITVFTNGLEDAYLVDAVVRGMYADDPWSKQYEIPKTARPQKFLIPKEEPVFYGNYADRYKNAWRNAVKRLEKCGLPIETMDYNFFAEASNLLYDGPCVAERWSDLGDFVLQHPDSIFPVTKEILASSCNKQYDASSVYKTQHLLQAYKRKAWNIMKNAVLIMPTCGGTWTRNQVRREPVETNNQMGLYTNHCNLLDMCAIAIPAGYAKDSLPFGVTLFATACEEDLLKGAAEVFLENETVPLAVYGLHMRGFALESQLLNLGAAFHYAARTAPKYRMYRLKTVPEKPGVIPCENGVVLDVEVWDIPLRNLGVFLSLIPSPLGIGKVQLMDGSWVNGFIFDQDPGIQKDDISQFGGWSKAQRNY